MRATDSILVLSLGCLSACGGGVEESEHEASPLVSVVKPTERVEEGWARELRSAIDFGDLGAARALLEQYQEALGFEAELLFARLLTAEGADFDAQRAIERARRAAPDDVRVPGTASEMHSAHGRTQSALEEIKRAYELGGARPEIHRAHAAHLLSLPGRAKEGLRHLEQARELDPTLPFLDRATGQAHLLLAKERLASNDLNEAMKAVELAYQYDPEEFETRRLLSDVLVAQKRIEDALLVMKELHADGYPVLGELASLEKRAAFVKLLSDEREAALDLFCMARSHGLSLEELGSGAQMLLDAAMNAVSEGVHAYESGELELARDRFERAVELDPELLIAHNHLGVVCYQLEDDGGAVSHWRKVWEVALEEGLELPEPVEINLARAMLRSGAAEAAREVLQESLKAAPRGLHAESVQRYLDAISSE